MPARGQKRRFGRVPLTSGLPQKADFLRVRRHVSNVPRTDSCAAAKPNLLLDVYRNFIRDDRRVERVVLGVAQHELKGMLTGRKFDARLGLTRSKMEMCLSWAIGSLGLRGSFTSISKW
jgi:hypothetical protein